MITAPEVKTPPMAKWDAVQFEEERLGVYATISRTLLLCLPVVWLILGAEEVFPWVLVWALILGCVVGLVQSERYISRKSAEFRTRMEALREENEAFESEAKTWISDCFQQLVSAIREGRGDDAIDIVVSLRGYLSDLNDARVGSKYLSSPGLTLFPNTNLLPSYSFFVYERLKERALGLSPIALETLFRSCDRNRKKMLSWGMSDAGTGSRNLWLLAEPESVRKWAAGDTECC